MPQMPSSSGQESQVKVDRDRQRRAKDSIEEVIKTHGKGAVVKFSDKPIPTEYIPTGSLTLDDALGIGGVPRGAMTEIFGPEGGGKSTLCLHIIAEAHLRGEQALYIDSENSFNRAYAERIGVNVNYMTLSQPDFGEQGFQIAQTFIKNEAVGVVVVDSVAMLVPKSEYEGEIGDAGVGQLARMVTQSIRLLNNDVRKSRVALIFINQIRDKIGVTWGPTETTPAGHLIKHMASVRMDIRRIAALKDGEKTIGARTKVKIVKNKFSAPFVECEYDLIFGEGISRAAELIDLGTKYKTVEKSGNSYLYKGERLGVGREQSRKFLIDTPDLFRKVYTETRKAIFDGKA